MYQRRSYTLPDEPEKVIVGPRGCYASARGVAHGRFMPFDASDPQADIEAARADLDAMMDLLLSRDGEPDLPMMVIAVHGGLR